MAHETTMQLYCYRSGVLKAARRAPPMTLPVVRAPRRRMMKAVVKLLQEKRLGCVYDGTLIVDSIARAKTMSAALTALLHFKAEVEGVLGRKHVARRLKRAVVRKGVGRGA